LFRVSPVLVVTVESPFPAKVFPAGKTQEAGTAGRPEPGDAHTVALFDPSNSFSTLQNSSHDLMAGNQGKAGQREVPFHDMKVRMAHSAGGYFHKDLAGLTWCRIRYFHVLQRLCVHRGRFFKQHGAHKSIPYFRFQIPDMKISFQN
jgi:hypothetical protein